MHDAGCPVEPAVPASPVRSGAFRALPSLRANALYRGMLAGRCASHSVPSKGGVELRILLCRDSHAVAAFACALSSLSNAVLGDILCTCAQ